MLPDEFTRGYVEAAVQSLGQDPARQAIEELTLTQVIADCREFQEQNEDDLILLTARGALDYPTCGMCFWESRQSKVPGFAGHCVVEPSKQFAAALGRLHQRALSWPSQRLWIDVVNDRVVGEVGEKTVADVALRGRDRLVAEAAARTSPGGEARSYNPYYDDPHAEWGPEQREAYRKFILGEPAA